MTTYVLSQQPEGWQVHRYSDAISLIGMAHTEDQARAMAFERAQKDAPAAVLRVGMNGESRFIAMIGDSDAGVRSHF